MNDDLLVNRAATAEDPTYEPINLSMIAQTQLYDPLCWRIRERIKESQNMTFEISEFELLQCTINLQSVFSILTFLRQRVIHMVHYMQVAGHSEGRKMFYYLRQHFYCQSMGVEAYNIE